MCSPLQRFEFNQCFGGGTQGTASPLTITVQRLSSRRSEGIAPRASLLRWSTVRSPSRLLTEAAGCARTSRFIDGPAEATTHRTDLRLTASETPRMLFRISQRRLFKVTLVLGLQEASSASGYDPAELILSIFSSPKASSISREQRTRTVCHRGITPIQRSCNKAFPLRSEAQYR